MKNWVGEFKVTYHLMDFLEIFKDITADILDGQHIKNLREIILNVGCVALFYPIGEDIDKVLQLFNYLENEGINIDPKQLWDLTLLDNIQRSCCSMEETLAINFDYAKFDEYCFRFWKFILDRDPKFLPNKIFTFVEERAVLTLAEFSKYKCIPLDHVVYLTVCETGGTLLEYRNGPIKCEGNTYAIQTIGDSWEGTRLPLFFSNLSNENKHLLREKLISEGGIQNKVYTMIDELLTHTIQIKKAE